MSTRLENPQSTSPFDVIIQNGLWFDGTGAAPAMRHIGMPGGEALTQNLSKCPCK